MKKSYIDAISGVTKLTPADVSKICMKCGNDKNRIIKFANLHINGTKPEEIFELIDIDNTRRTNAVLLHLGDEHIEVFNVQENLITLKTGDLIEAAEGQKAIVSAEIQVIGMKEFRANDYLELLNHFNERSLTRIIRVAYHKGVQHTKEGIPQMSTIIICAEGTPWE